MLPIIVIVGVATLLIYFYLTWNHDYWRKQNVPYIEPSSLIFGNVKDLITGKKNMGKVFQEIYRHHEGSPLIGFFKLRQPALLLKDPELIKMVLVKEFNNFHDNDFDVSHRADPIAAENPFFINGQRWKTVRGAISQCLSGAKLKASLPSILESCKHLVKHLENAEGHDVEVKQLAAKFTNESVFSSGFGIETNALLDPESKIFNSLGSIFAAESWIKYTMQIMIFMPILADIFKLSSFSDSFFTFFTDIVKQAAEHREQSGVKRADFLQSLLDIKNGALKSDGTPKLKVSTYEDIAIYGAVLFADGTETSTRPITFVLYEIALNADIQTKLRDEIRANVSSLDELVNMDKVNSLTYLDMVVSESLRKYPPGLSLNRRCTQPISLQLNNGNSCTILPGTLVAVPIFALHYDPKYYPDPDTFDPERFSEEAKATRHKFTYLPFGEGPRMCLGVKFALAQVKMALAVIVKEFEILPTERTQVPLRLDNELIVMTTVKDDLWLQFKKIKTDKQ